ncbi:hypothetical protein [Streptomyces antarcticus]|uniref:hypothetical protein n=1 Tax=Streptomyces antarcticus TaxID=2996458 RepID=UPI00226D6FF2|nr:hypothetical protein [Streptomyces sp. H34-AA3]MCY0946808.1 hypothetical protein [Streptomyces sp. H34-AA3]
MSETDVQQAAREVLAIVREVEKQREDSDPGTPEPTLGELSTAAARLVYALPLTLLPPEELRPVSVYEVLLIDELLGILADLEGSEG